MEKNLKYYMGLNYVIEIVTIPNDKGGGVLAKIPIFGSLGVVGDGNTVEEALANLEISKEIVLEILINDKKVIPEPADAEILEDYSGKLLTRMPKWLHHKLAIQAENNNSSLNQYIVTLLASGVEQDISLSRYEEINNNIVNMCTSVKEMKDDIKSRFAMSFSFGVPYSDEYGDAKAA